MAQWQKIVERFGIQKVYWASVIVLLALGISSSLLVDQLGNSFSVDGMTFVYDDVDNHFWTFKDEQGNPLTAVTEHRQYRLDSDTALFINYKGMRIKRVSNLEDFTNQIYNGDTLVYSGDLFPLAVDLLGIDTEVHKKGSAIYEYRLIKGILTVADHVQSGLFFNLVLCNVILIFLGTAQVAFPHYFWHWKHFLDVKGGEPTAFYLVTTRGMGVVLAVAGVVVAWVVWLVG